MDKAHCYGPYILISTHILCVGPLIWIKWLVDPYIGMEMGWVRYRRNKTMPDLPPGVTHP